MCFHSVTDRTVQWIVCHMPDIESGFESEDAVHVYAAFSVAPLLWKHIVNMPSVQILTAT